MSEYVTIEQKLKPCPHCGKDVEMMHIEPHDHILKDVAKFMPRHNGSYFINCNCGSGMIDNEKDALIKRWDTRHTPPGLAWTKTPPTEKDIGKHFLIRWISKTPDKTKRMEVFKLHCVEENARLSHHLFGDNYGLFECNYTLKQWQNINAEFLGPLPE